MEALSNLCNISRLSSDRPRIETWRVLLQSSPPLWPPSGRGKPLHCCDPLFTSAPVDLGTQELSQSLIVLETPFPPLPTGGGSRHLPQKGKKHRGDGCGEGGRGHHPGGLTGF